MAALGSCCLTASMNAFSSASGSGSEHPKRACRGARFVGYAVVGLDAPVTPPVTPACLTLAVPPAVAPAVTLLLHLTLQLPVHLPLHTPFPPPLHLQEVADLRGNQRLLVEQVEELVVQTERARRVQRWAVGQPRVEGNYLLRLRVFVVEHLPRVQQVVTGVPAVGTPESTVTPTVTATVTATVTRTVTRTVTPTVTRTITATVSRTSIDDSRLRESTSFQYLTITSSSVQRRTTSQTGRWYNRASMSSNRSGSSGSPSVISTTTTWCNVCNVCNGTGRGRPAPSVISTTTTWCNVCNVCNDHLLPPPPQLVFSRLDELHDLPHRAAEGRPSRRTLRVHRPMQLLDTNALPGQRRHEGVVSRLPSRGEALHGRSPSTLTESRSTLPLHNATQYRVAPAQSKRTAALWRAG